MDEKVALVSRLRVITVADIEDVTFRVFLHDEPRTTAEAEALVKRAVAHIKTQGREKAFADLSNKKGDFVNRDLFVFVYDMQGKCLAHGRNSEKIGENMINFKDSTGKYIVKERIEIARGRGRGWQEYKSIDPTTKKAENKAAYIEVCDDLIVAAGAYK